MLDVGADVHEDMVAPLVALRAALDVAAPLVNEHAALGEAPREGLEPRLVDVRARVVHAEGVRAAPELVELDAHVRVADRGLRAEGARDGVVVGGRGRGVRLGRGGERGRLAVEERRALGRLEGGEAGGEDEVGDGDLKEGFQAVRERILEEM